jgi:hypothetical protein
MELREIHREITAPALACVWLEAQVVVEADRLVPIATGLDDQPAQAALAGVIDEPLAERTRNAPAAIGVVSRDAHDLAGSRGLNQQSASADEGVVLATWVIRSEKWSERFAQDCVCYRRLMGSDRSGLAHA